MHSILTPSPLKSTGFPTSYVVVTPKPAVPRNRVRDRHQTHDHSFDAAHRVTSRVDPAMGRLEVFTRSRKRSCNSQVEPSSWAALTATMGY